ncbi:ABC transporter ATP-binding protein [Tistrella mobilis]|uniref:ABC transporter ATP-binding protein n=1 Tax=Tistrella mobilis TaxID=171437 RepID=UPI003556E565
MTVPLLVLERFGIAFPGRGRVVPVVEDISLALRPGEVLGMVGESGSGKSITWQGALGLAGPGAVTSGRVLVDGRDVASADDHTLAGLRGRRIAMIFQDPMTALNPVLTVGRQIVEALALHRGLRGRAARAEAGHLLDRVGIPGGAGRLRAYPHELSGGMCQRVMIAIALAGDPAVLIADEPTTALDATVQAQILDLLDDVRRERGMALVLISHDLGLVAAMADRVAVLYAGRVVELGAAGQVLKAPCHPYTAGLRAAMPAIHGPRRRLTGIPGRVPAPGEIAGGCRFAPRCGRAAPACRAHVPALEGGSHLVACFRPMTSAEACA